jgi:hypothetical protein
MTTRRLGAQQRLTGARPAVAERGTGAKRRRRRQKKGRFYFLSVWCAAVKGEHAPRLYLPAHREPPLALAY